MWVGTDHQDDSGGPTGAMGGPRDLQEAAAAAGHLQDWRARAAGARRSAASHHPQVPAGLPQVPRQHQRHRHIDNPMQSDPCSADAMC